MGPAQERVEIILSNGYMILIYQMMRIGYSWVILISLDPQVTETNQEAMLMTCLFSMIL
jgi:hypothetical protein